MADWKKSARQIVDNSKTSSSVAQNTTPGADNSSGSWKSSAQKIVDNAKNRTYELKTDTKYFGDVSYDAYKAVIENKLESYKPKSAAEGKILDDVRSYIGLAPRVISDYVPSAYNMTRREYLRRRQSNTDMPEFGSYDYFKNREEELRPVLEEIANDTDRLDVKLKEYAEHYGKDNGWAEGTSVQKLAKEMYEKFKYQDAIIAEYKDINEQLNKFDKQGIHYDKSGEIDAESGAAEAKYAKERLDSILNTSALTTAESAAGMHGELPEDKQTEYDNLRAAASKKNVEAEKEKAYNYYAENKDNSYKDNIWGRITGNYMLGRIGIETNKAGFTSFKESTDDIEATEVYQALSERIQKRNNATFQNDNSIEEITAMVAQYAPQAVDQAIHKTVGSVMGAVAGWATGLGALETARTGGSAMVAKYVYRQTAGAAFVRLLQESDLSIEDARRLADSEARASEVIEFGLDRLTSGLWKNYGAPAKSAASALGKKTLKALTSIGISEKGAKLIINIAKNACKLAVDALGEGTEEWIQEGMSITADRYAAEGKSASPFELFTKSFDLRQYSEEDFSRMNQSFLAGTIIGFGHGGLNAALSFGINKAVSAAAGAVDAEVLGDEINKSGETKLITDAVEMAKNDVSPEVANAVKAVETAIAEGNTPPAEAVGTVVKSVLSNDAAQEVAEDTKRVGNEDAKKTASVSIGDTFEDTKTGNTITVTERDSENTTVAINTGEKTETREYSNVQADNLVTNERLKQVETSGTDFPEDLQSYNIAVSNLKRKAEELGLLDNDFVTALQNVDLYNPSESDKALISREFHRVLAGNTDPLVTSWLDSISSDTQTKNITLTRVGDFYEAYGDEAVELANQLNLTPTIKTVNGDKVQTVRFPVDSLDNYRSILGGNYNFSVSDTPGMAVINGENTHDSAENVSVDEDIAGTDIDTAEGEILSLRHTQSVYSLFKGAARVVVGKDIITDGFVVIPLTDEALAGVKSVVGDTVQESPNFELSKFYHKDNDVVIQGDPKIDEISVRKKAEKGYVFKIGNAFYTCQQKFIDAFNNGKNTITASKRVNIPWTVHDENGEFVALFLGTDHAMNEERFNSLQSVGERKTADRQKRAENANKPFNSSEVKLIVMGDRIPCVFEMDGSKFVTEGQFSLRTDEAGIAQLNETVIPYHFAPDGMQTVPADSIEKMLNSSYSADVGELIPYTPENRKSAKTPPCYAFVADGIAHLYNKKFVDALKKRSASMRLTSGGTLNTTLLVGYDVDGNITGFVLPLRANENSFVDKDGNKIPFATNDNLKALVKGKKGVSAVADVENNADSTKITVGMSDDLRAELLNKKSVNVVSFNAERASSLENIDFDALQKTLTRHAKPIIEKVANEFGILNKSYYNPDIELDFEYSKSSLKESINKQHSIYGDFVKMLSVLPDIISNAVGIETHEDKYKGTIRENTALKQMYVLVSALRDETGVIPVKLEVKELKEQANKLYLSVVLTKKENRYPHGTLGQNQLNTATPVSAISIADLIDIVNSKEGDFLKYFPDGMLDSEQIEAKNRALAKDAERIEKLTSPSKNETDKVTQNETRHKKRSLAIAENADALSFTSKTTNSTASDNIVSKDNDIVNDSIHTEAENDTSTVYDVAFFEKLGSDIRKGESPSLKDSNTVLSAVEKTIKPEIVSNANLMGMLANKFGGNGVEGLVNEIIARYNKGEAIGDFENLFIDSGKELYTALQNQLSENAKYSLSNPNTERLFVVSSDVMNNFATQVDGWLNRALSSSELLKLGDTPEVLKRLGASDLPVVMNQDVLVKITGGKHNISLDEIKNLPQAISDPIMVFKSATVPNSFVILTELTDKSGNDIVAAMHLNRKQDRISVNRIASVYGKYNIEKFVTGHTENGNLKYIDKNKSQQWATSRGLQLPKLVQSITDNNSILEKEDIVNTYNTLKSAENSLEANENGGNNLLLGDGGRQLDASAGKQVEKLSKFKQEIKGKTRAERKSAAEELLAKGLTEEKIDGEHKYNLVKPEGYNDDMLSIIEEAKSKGKDVGFFIGHGQRNFDGQRNFLIDGIKITDSKILIRYDGAYSPQTLLRHEEIHSDWNNPEIQKAKAIILNDLSDAKKKELLSDGRYMDYMELYEGDTDAVWEEFIADVFAGMNDYTPDYIDTVVDYWYDGKVIDKYNPAEYSNTIDAGGNAAVLNAIGLGNDYGLSERGELNGSENAEALAERGAGQDNDSVWTRSDDTEEAYERLDGVNGNKRISLEKRRGFVDWGRELQSDSFGSTREKKRNYGILRKISERRISTVDSVGRDLSANIVRYFANTVFKNKNGELIPLFHATDNDFNTFELGEFGFHIGSAEQAINRGGKHIKELYVNITNPLYISTDRGMWTAFVVACEAENQGIITQDDYNSISKMDGFHSKEFNSKANVSLRRLLKANGYDGIIYNNGFEGEGISAIAFDSNQLKYVSNQSPTASPDVRYSLSTAESDAEFWEKWLNLAKEYGAIPKGENPVRDIDVPQKISDKKFVSRFARTMLEAGITPEENVSDFEKAILSGDMTHEVITDKKALNSAREKIKELGFKEALNRWTVSSEEGIVGKKQLALGMELYNQCVTNKDVHNAMKIASELAAEATHAGQTLQACRLLKLMTPDGQLYYLEKSIQKMNEEFREKLKDKYKDIELDEELTKKFLSEKDETKRNLIYDELCQSIADQIPATLRDKWNSWRYLAMLGNPRTHIRNIAGNAVFVLPIKLKNYIGAVIERAAKVDASERTKSLRKSKKAVEFAKRDFSKMQKVLQGENAKYAVTSDVEGKRTIFKTKWLEGLRNKNFDFLEMEDMWFLKFHYVDALAQILTARNLDVNNIDEKTLDIARAYAVREAQRATYRDANSLAEALNKLQKKLEHSDKKTDFAKSVLIEGVMPFKKTPLNIAKQGVQYSPAGILSGVYKTVSKIKNGGAYSATDIIDDFAKGLAGTAIMLVGLFLASLGIVSGGDDENKKKRAFDEMVGEQSFSLNIGGISYTIDWMAPACLPFFTGAKLYELTKDDFKFADIINALVSLTDPLLELSVFSGIRDAIKSAQYNETNELFAIGSDMTTSYFTQALPTIGGQLSRIIDKNKREYYYIDKNSNLPYGVQSLIGQVSSKIPFASYLFEPSIDEWGREVTYGGIVERALENAVSPGYYSEKNYTEVDEEIKRLYESTGDADVLPVIQQKKYTESKIDYPMTAAQYTEAKRIRGQKSFELIGQLLSDGLQIKLLNKETNKYQMKTYSQMSDEEKVKAIKRCYEKAGDETKEIMLEKVKGNR